jgi:ABC-type Mn2+/Zn2+ transport system ATPase subunit
VSDLAIELQNVSVTRAHRRILHVPQLAVPRGSFLGIIGPNGAGKTTLLRVCASLIPADGGFVRIFGYDSQLGSAWRRSSIRRWIGYVPQTVEFMSDIPFTTRDVVSMGLFGCKGLFRKLDAKDQRKVSSWIDRLGLNALSGNMYRNLSGGEQRKALVARAMVQEPKLLLLDEPAANLDLDWKEQLTQLIEGLFTEYDITVVMVSHETWQLPPSCERVVLMKDGNVVSVGPKGEALSSDALSELYSCRVETVVRGDRYHSLSAGVRREKNAPD